jgi:hypothetical protein
MNSLQTAENDVEEEERRKIEPEEVIFNDFSGNKGRLFSLFFKDILPPTTSNDT